jgi:ABC-type phosphate transport system substrate-binding protein
MAVLTLFCASGIAGAEDFKLIGNPSVPETSLERDVVARIFLIKLAKWPNGTGVVPVDQSQDSKVREAFSRSVHQKPTPAVVAYWHKQVFSGLGIPPLTKGSDAEVLQYVRTTPGAIGYVSPQAPVDGVKVLALK